MPEYVQDEQTEPNCNNLGRFKALWDRVSDTDKRE